MCIHINLLNEQCSCIHVCLSACTLYFCTPLPPTNSRSLLYPPIHAPSLLTQTHLPSVSQEQGIGNGIPNANFFGSKILQPSTQRHQVHLVHLVYLVHQVHDGSRGTPGPKHVDRVCTLSRGNPCSFITHQSRAICPSALHPLSSDPDSSAGQVLTRWARN